MSTIGQDRLVRKEVALGLIREMPKPTNHVGLEIAPFLAVQSDDVIFEYVQPQAEGLAPARAEDAESELARKDTSMGSGRASLIDWAIKDHYSASDVTRYREAMYVQGSIGQNLPLTITSMTEDWQNKVARDTALRRRKLDNRIESLIWDALVAGSITYDDGKIKFSVDYSRPALQSSGNLPTNTAATAWSASGADPIDNVLDIDTYMYDTYGVHIAEAWCSSKVLRNVLNSDKFAARTGISTGVDPRYVIDGWGVEAAVAVLERATGVRFRVHDAIYRTKPFGSNTITNNRFLPEDKIVFMPAAQDLAEIATSEIGFGKVLTSPHPEGNFQPGYYEWERETVDPWGYDIGTGIKAFPVFPHLDLTYVLDVL